MFEGLFVIKQEDDHLRVRDYETDEVLGEVLESDGEYMVLDSPELGTFRSLFVLGMTLAAAKSDGILLGVAHLDIP